MFAFIFIPLAFAMFAGPVVQAETGLDVLSYGPAKLCSAIDGKYDGYRMVGGNGKEAGPKAKVPYCKVE